jgi:hypothetical protein
MVLSSTPLIHLWLLLRTMVVYVTKMNLKIIQVTKLVMCVIQIPFKLMMVNAFVTSALTSR